MKCEKELISKEQSKTLQVQITVEFKAYFKDEQGQEVEKLERKANDEQNYLYLQVDVKKEGFFITLEEVRCF